MGKGVQTQGGMKYSHPKPTVICFQIHLRRVARSERTIARLMCGVRCDNAVAHGQFDLQNRTVGFGDLRAPVQQPRLPREGPPVNSGMLPGRGGRMCD